MPKNTRGIKCRRIHNPGLLITSLLVLSAYAQPGQANDWYQVEVILFSQQDGFGDEQYPLKPVLSYPQRLRFLDNAEQLYPDLPANPTYNEQLAALMVPEKFLSRQQAMVPASFVPLDSQLRKLNPDAYALRRNNSYRVLYHAAWQQPVTGPKSAPWINIQGGDRFDDHSELEGTLRIYQSRFMHLEFNLWRGQFTANTIAVTPLQTEDQTTAEGDDALTLPTPPQQPISKYLRQLRQIDTMNLPVDGELLTSEPAESSEPAEQKPQRFKVTKLDTLRTARQVSVNDLTYIDHPRMGALVLITPVVSEESNDEQ